VRDSMKRPGRGPIKPKYAAEFALCESGLQLDSDLGTIGYHFEDLLATTTGQSFSQAQRDFLTGSDALAVIDRGDMVRRHYMVRLYAAGEDDARKMTEALIEALINRTNERMRERENTVRELEEKVAETKKKIAEAEEELKDAQPDFDSFRKNVHYRDHLEAEEALSGFNKMLNTLNVELSGIRARLETIRIFQDKGKAEGFATTETIGKLEQMYIEQTIELKAAEAKMHTITPLRNAAKTFVELSLRLQAAESTKYNLSNDLKRYKEPLSALEGELAHRTAGMPPKVFQNKATIYRVRAGD